MCTAVLSVEPGLPLLLAGVRDELADRAWDPPGRHWPQFPDLVGGQDRLAGGTWLAVSPRHGRVACVLNGRGQAAPTATRRSRGILPLRAASGQPVDRSELRDLDPFLLLTAEPGLAVLQGWDGRDLTERLLLAGLHFVVNSGLASDLAGKTTDSPASPSANADPATDGREHELGRIAHFAARFQAAARPAPQPGQPTPEAWGAWLPLVDGDGLDPRDNRALIVRRNLGGGRIWGTSSISLVALSADGVLRYDFTAQPGNPAAWYPVLNPPTSAHGLRPVERLADDVGVPGVLRDLGDQVQHHPPDRP